MRGDVATTFNPRVLLRDQLDGFITALGQDGREVLGPTIRDGAIQHDVVTSSRDLPVGMGDAQAPGQYRLVPRADAAVFGFTVGAQGLKKFFHAPQEQLFTVQREGRGLRFVPTPVTVRKLALLGVRGCDLAALGVLDRVLLEDAYQDARYAARRSDVFIVAVHCGTSSSSCFCPSMGTGPRATQAWDLALTELLEGQHRFLLEVGSDAGETLVAALGLPHASQQDVAAGTTVTTATAAGITRSLDTNGLPAILQSAAEHARWDDVASRCLTCTNCTLVCPTCFCTSLEDSTALDGTAQRTRQWDSCFTADFSYLHGGEVRGSVKARYRQWLTHKLSTWQDQFGSLGCVGCGRCISWCPVGIDLTKEATLLREPSPPNKKEG